MQTKIKNYSQTLDWLLEEDQENPGVRLFTLRELLDKSESDKEVQEAQQAVMQLGPVPRILAEQADDGYWVQPGAGYHPKYRSTIWSFCFLSQLGADGQHAAIRKAADYLLENARAPFGGFSMDATQSKQIHCLQGNLIDSMLNFGFEEDPRLQEAIQWLARSITGEGIAPNTEKQTKPHYLRSGNSAPGFVCSATGQQPCAWGAVKAMLALSRIPEDKRSPLINQAIEQGSEFLLNGNPAQALYPTTDNKKPSGSWFKFGFPLFYVTDVLQNLEALTRLGYGKDERLRDALDLLLSKQDENGRWKMEYTYNGKTWVDIEEKKLPSKWVTLRALMVLKRACA